MSSKDIRVTCDTKLRVPLDELHAIQGNLKIASVEAYKKFRKLIVDRGINFSLHVWKEIVPCHSKSEAKRIASVKKGRQVDGSSVIKWWIVDGHLRKLLLAKMRTDEGYSIPPLPCVEIEAVSLKDARKQVLAASSNFHKLSRDGLYEFLAENEMPFEELEGFDLPDIDLPKFKAEFYDDETAAKVEEELYTKKILAPIYEPKGERPELTSLVDLTKTDTLLDEIDRAKLPEEAKAFLRYAANRHAVFNYELIAEYYAHAPKKMKALIEKSALVIIDFDKAIENGFVALSEMIAEAYEA